MAQLSGVRGAQYFPSYAYNAYQTWWLYDDSVIERELNYAQQLGLNSLRVFCSYEFWRDQGRQSDWSGPNRHLANLEHFLTQCNQRGIRPILELFEATPKGQPSQDNLQSTDPANAFGTKSPSSGILSDPSSWGGALGTPKHFTRRLANGFGEDSRVLAWEIMNEPGDAVNPPKLNRHDFAKEMLSVFRSEAPGATLTMGCMDTSRLAWYDRDDELDVWQFHMNLPKNPQDAREYVQTNVNRTSKPVWCTEYQRTLEEPPSRFLPYLNSLAPTMHELADQGILDGHYFWQLMLSPAYLRDPRNAGRVNGLMHADGAAFNVNDAEAVARGNAGVSERLAYPSSWATHPFPYPDPQEIANLRGGDGGGGGGGGGDGGGSMNRELGLALALGLGAYVVTRDKN